MKEITFQIVFSIIAGFCLKKGWLSVSTPMLKSEKCSDSTREKVDKFAFITVPLGIIIYFVLNNLIDLNILLKFIFMYFFVFGHIDLYVAFSSKKSNDD